MRIKKWFFRFCILLTSGSLAASVTTQKALSLETEPKPCSFDRVVEDHAKNRYSQLLNELHQEYLAKKDRAGQSFLKYRNISEAPSSLSDAMEAHGSFRNKMHFLRTAQNRELIDVCIRYPNDPLSRKVKDMIFFTPTKQEQESLDYLLSLTTKKEGEGKTPIENRLIAIDLEFWIKERCLEVSAALQEAEEHHLVLTLEKLRQMKDAVQGPNVDPKVKQSIEIAARVYPKMKSFAATGQHLSSLGEKTLLPKTDAEKQFQRIIEKYQTREQNFIAQYFPPQESKEQQTAADHENAGGKKLQTVTSK